MKITFGKFKGWETEDLARAGAKGRDYLHWGLFRFTDPKWLKEFRRVLDLPIEYNFKLMVQAIVADTPDITSEEACMIAHEELEYTNYVDEEYEDFLNQQETISKWAKTIGVSEKKLRTLHDKFKDSWHLLPATMFSSDEMYENFCKFMEEF